MSDIDDDLKKLEAAQAARSMASGLREKTKNSKYYSPKEAIDEVKYAIGVKDTSVATAKLLGKSIFNIGCFAVTELMPGMLEQAASNTERKIKNK